MRCKWEEIPLLLYIPWHILDGPGPGPPSKVAGGFRKEEIKKIKRKKNLEDLTWENGGGRQVAK